MQQHEQPKCAVGIDTGKRMMIVRRLYQDGRVDHAQFSTNAKGRERLRAWLRREDIVGIETCAIGLVIAEAIRSVVSDVLILNSGRLKIIHQSTKKTDSEDAMKIARLVLRTPKEELPTVPMPTEAEKRARRIVSEHDFQRTLRTRLINRMHAIFVHAGITTVTKRDLKNEKRRPIVAADLPEQYAGEWERHLKTLEVVEAHLETLYAEIRREIVERDGDAKIVMSMPGMGPISTLTVLAYIDPARFDNASQVSNYAGLVPRVDISSDTVRLGHIVPGCHAIKSVIIQAAWALVRSKEGGAIKDKYEELSTRRGDGKAIVATARRMVEVLYVMLKKRTNYRYVSDDSLEKKYRFYGLTA
jgi:transposase